MTYRARLPAELDEADLTHGERELARWAALPFERKLRIGFYLLRRSWRVARNEAWRTAHVAAWEASVYARAICANAVAVSRALASTSEAEWAAQRRPVGAEIGRWRLGNTDGDPRGREEAGSEVVAIAAALAVVLLVGSLQSDRKPSHRPSIVEQARAVRDYYPPRCFYEADGDVVVMDSTWRVIRPNDRRRDRLLSQLCG